MILVNTLGSTLNRILMSKLYTFVLALVLSVTFAHLASAQATFPKGELSIQTAENLYDFDVELALDDEHRAFGLMYRNSLPEMNGMLFIYDRERELAMWMKNTFIPLDILFIDDEGKIITIAKSTQPRSLDRISSKGLAKAVLELNGGLTDKLGIMVGDEIIYETFGNTEK